MSFLPFKDIHPQLGKNIWLAPGAFVIGDVTIGDNTNIWFNTVVRGDVNTITIGTATNIQDNSTIHVTQKTGPTHIGSYVTIGHQCTIHACRIDDYTLIGMGTVILDKAHIPEYAMIGAGSLVTAKSQLKSHWLHVGSPCQAVRPLKEAEIEYLKVSALNYIETSANYSKADIGTTSP